MSLEERRQFFSRREGNRYWWHRKIEDGYVPDVYAALSDDEWKVLAAWYEETDAKSMVGECAIPPIAWLASFVSANNVSRIVQLGSYAGYSTLILGWTLRRMGKRKALVAVDIDPLSVSFTTEWVRRAGIEQQVLVHQSDSSDPALSRVTRDYLSGAPQLVFIDSSHQYAHTLRELDLWYAQLGTGGLIALHDTSDFASTYDSTGAGGVKRALGEWQAKAKVSAFNLAYPTEILNQVRHVYLDGCGLGVIVKDGARI